MRFVKYLFLLLSFCVTLSCDAQNVIVDASGNTVFIDPTEAAVQSVYTKAVTAGITFTTDEKQVIRNIVTSQMRQGFWPYVYNFKMGWLFGTEQKCLFDWITGRVGTGTGTWTAADGMQTDGATNHINADFIESTDAINPDGSSSLNDISYTVYLVSNDHGTSAGTLMGTQGTSATLQSRLDQTGTTITYKAQNSATVSDLSAGPFTSGRYYTLYRNRSNRQGRYINFDQGGTNGNAVGGISNRTMFIGAHNGNGTTSNRMAGKFGTFFACSATRVTSFAPLFVELQWAKQLLGFETKEALYPYDMALKAYNINQAFVIGKYGQSNQAGRSDFCEPKLRLLLDALTFWRPPPYPATPMLVQQLQFGINHTYENLAENGNELRLCYQLSQMIRGKVTLCKYPWSGTDLAGNTTPTWKLSANDLSNTAFNTITVPGLQILDNTYTIKTFVYDWNQFEADINGTTEATYKLEWSNLFNYFITQTEAGGLNYTTTTDLHVVIRKVYSGITGSTVAEITAAQVAMQAYFAANFPTAAAKVKSWTIYETNSPIYYYADNVHMGSLGQDMDGYRLAMYYARL